MARSYKTEAVVLRSIRYAEADRVLHLYTAERGRVNAIAKGVRKTSSRFGARLEPLTHAALMLHEGRGELHTVSGADIVHAHHAARAHDPRPAGGRADRRRGGAQAVRRAGAEPAGVRRAGAGSSTCWTSAPSTATRRSTRLGLAFQLKLLAVAGYLPHLDSCASCGAPAPLVGFSAAAGGAVCEALPRPDRRLPAGRRIRSTRWSG